MSLHSTLRVRSTRRWCTRSLPAIVVCAALGGLAATHGEAAAPASAQVVAIVDSAAGPRLMSLDARTLKPVRPGWSLKLKSWSRNSPAVLSPLGSRVAVALGGETNQRVLIVDTTDGRTVKLVRNTSAEGLYWLYGEGTSRRSPALLLQATLTCASGGIPGGVCGDDVTPVWASDPRLEPGGSVIYNDFYVSTALRTAVVLASSGGPKAVVVEPGPGTLSDTYVELSEIPDEAPFQITADVLRDRLFVVTSTGQIARISRASSTKPVIDYHNVSLNGRAFQIVWAGIGRIALWGADGLGTIDTRTWTTHAIAPGVTGAVATKFGIAAWTDNPADGLTLYRPDGRQRRRQLIGKQIKAARAVGDYLYADTAEAARYSINLRTGKVVGPLSTEATILVPDLVAIP